MSNIEQWIDDFAKYNVINNTGFALAWGSHINGDKDAITDDCCTRGNSRAEPEPCFASCRNAANGCTYRHYFPPNIAAHKKKCQTESLIEPRVVEPTTVV